MHLFKNQVEWQALIVFQETLLKSLPIIEWVIPNITLWMAIYQPSSLCSSIRCFHSKRPWLCKLRDPHQCIIPKANIQGIWLHESIINLNSSCKMRISRTKDNNSVQAWTLAILIFSHRKTPLREKGIHSLILSMVAAQKRVKRSIGNYGAKYLIDIEKCQLMAIY